MPVGGWPSHNGGPCQSNTSYIGSRAWAYRLMSWIGVMDIILGLTMAVVPLRVVLLHLTVWGLWTAALRPLSGDVVWEFFERAGNYGVPLAFLVFASVPC